MTAKQASSRKYEAECLAHFDKELEWLPMPPEWKVYRGQDENCFDPDWELIGRRRFQFGDLRVEPGDRIVVVEAESNCSKSLSNLVKYWPLAQLSSQTLPILLLHVFRRRPHSKGYLSHLKLWEFTWEKMKAELWNQDGRVAPASYPAEALPDPDMEISTIRLHREHVSRSLIPRYAP
jgi:hypothetical protein